MTRRKQVRKEVKPSIQDWSIAHRVAVYYRRAVKNLNIHLQPWRPDIPVQEQPVFAKFLDVVSLMKAIGADYPTFISAQFEHWNGPSRTHPLPNQLCTQSAIERYNRAVLAVDRSPVTVRETREDRVRDGFKHEETKLARIAEAMHMSEQEVLKNEYDEFSREFLVSRGVWEKVADAWLATFND